MMGYLRKLFRRPKWYAVSFFTADQNNRNGYNRSFCWTYSLDADQVTSWEKQLCEIRSFNNAITINIVPLSRGQRPTDEEQK